MSVQSQAPAVVVGAATHVNARYLVVGPSDPGFLPRLLEPVAKLGEVPTRVHASRESGDGSELSVDVRLSGVSARTAELVENALRRIVGVRQVIAVVE
ncbi:MAG: hypothetical protein ACKVP3_18625 [Hyphomicrobiaceae bacterium]